MQMFSVNVSSIYNMFQFISLNKIMIIIKEIWGFQSCRFAVSSNLTEQKGQKSES